MAAGILLLVYSYNENFLYNVNIKQLLVAENGDNRAVNVLILVQFKFHNYYSFGKSDLSLVRLNN